LQFAVIQPEAAAGAAGVEQEAELDAIAQRLIAARTEERAAALQARAARPTDGARRRVRLVAAGAVDVARKRETCRAFWRGSAAAAEGAGGEEEAAAARIA